MRTKGWQIAATSLMLVGLLLADCAPASQPIPVSPTAKPGAAVPEASTPTALTATPKPAADQPRKGGVLNKTTRSEPPHFDLHISGAGIQLFTLGPVYSGLIQYDPQKPGMVAPDLAERWTASNDGLSYTFDLRKGVKWHDGLPLTVQDVKLSLERPKHIIDRKKSMKDDILGTGAFTFKRFDRGSYMYLERNPNYFIPDRPYLDGIRTYYIADEATSISALRTGQLDFLINPSDAGVETIKDKFKEATPGQMRQSQWRAMYLPVDRPPFNDIRVRKAVQLAVDRQAAIKVVMGGNAELGSVIPAAMGGIPSEELAKRPGYRQPKDADIAEAKRLLAEAGYNAGFKTSTLYRKGTAYEIAAVFMRDQLAKIGIELALKTVDDAAFYEIRQKEGFDSFTHRRAITAYDPDAILMQEYKGGVPDNWSNIADPELDRLIDLQSREQDREKRKALVRQANERIEELATTVVLTWAGYWRVWGPRVKNFVLPSANYDDEKMVDVWVTQ